MLEWLSEQRALLYTLFIVSIVSLVLTAVLLPLIVIRLPSNYFTRRPGARRVLPRSKGNIFWHLFKNLVGGVFVLAGIAMLVLPGQGLLTILIGVLMLDFPGKYRLERWFVQRRGIRNSMNRLRARFDRPPLRFEPDRPGNPG